jgi:NADPH2:quinone reductase
MKAYLTEPPGGWEATRLTDIPAPDAKPGRVLVGIRAVGLNPADAFQIEGRYPGGPKPPFIAGRDAAGLVVEPDQNGRWQAGTEVIVLESSTTDLKNGTLCEQQWIGAENLAPLPPGWSFAEGAAAPLVYLTAWLALNGPAPIAPKEAVLVTGASGGVGFAAVQLAVSQEAVVVALSRSEAKRMRLLDEGAHFAFDPADPQLKEKVFGAIGKKGADVVVETVGGPSLSQAFHLIGVHGRISSLGVLAGVEATLPIPSFMFKRASLHGILVSDYSPSDAQSAWSQIVAVLTRSGRRPAIDRCFPFAETRQAFDHLRGDVFGKVVVEIGA